MPVYEYFCESCEEEFEITLSLKEHEHPEDVACPHCGSHVVHQVATAFTAVTSRKS